MTSALKCLQAVTFTVLGVAAVAAVSGIAGRARAESPAASPSDASPAFETLPPSRGGQDLIGKPMPELAFDRWLDTPDDGALPVEGRVTLYRWWTQTCPHCEATLPAVEKLRRAYGPKGLQTVAVYHPKPPREVKDAAVRKAAAARGYEGPLAVDADWSELKRAYLSTGRRQATSVSLLVDRKGVIRFVHPGPRFYPCDDPGDAREDQDYKLLEKAVAALLDEK